MTAESPLDQRRKAQEEEYFRKQNAEAAAKLKAKADLQASGVQDTALINHLMSAGFDSDAARALYILPLIDVAWADGKVQADEKKQILNLLEKRGIDSKSKAFAIVNRWIDLGSKDESYLHAKTLIEPLVNELKKAGKDPSAWIIDAAEQVAKATNNIFGLGSNMISKEEKSVLQDLANKLAK